jgi:SAM-dependent methyltransferase
MLTCRICGNSRSNKEYVAREMMFGSGDEFEYFQCAECGCLQISQIPADLSKYYVADYYAYVRSKPNPFVSFLKKQRALYAFTGRSTLGRILVKWYGMPRLMDWVKQWMVHGRLNLGDAILDVGCGTGSHLPEIWDVGFEHLTGIDPYIKNDIDYGHGIRVFKMHLNQVKETYDFVMLHHSFEHMPDPESTIRHIHRVLAPGRYALIRIPVVSSYAWRTYGLHWVQLDAPRHLHLHTRRSMEILADRVGFQITEVLYDSNELQFWGSEQYVRGIPYMSPRSYFVNRRKSVFSQSEIDAFRRRAEELNESGDGDSACFYLRKPSGSFTSHGTENPPQAGAERKSLVGSARQA